MLCVEGAFVGAHREDLVGLIRNIEERERIAHPLKRIMEVSEQEGRILVTTTDPRLARNLGDAVHHAYGGEIEYQYTEEGNVLRVEWRR